MLSFKKFRAEMRLSVCICGILQMHAACSIFQIVSICDWLIHCQCYREILCVWFSNSMEKCSHRVAVTFECVVMCSKIRCFCVVFAKIEKKKKFNSISMLFYVQKAVKKTSIAKILNFDSCECVFATMSHQLEYSYSVSSVRAPTMRCWIRVRLLFFCLAHNYIFD